MNVTQLYAAPISTSSEQPAQLQTPVHFTVGSVLRLAHASYRAQALPLTLLSGLGLGLGVAFGAIAGAFGEVVARAFGDTELSRFLLGTFLAQTASFVFSTFISIGMLRVFLAAARGQPVRTSLLFSGMDAFVPMLGSSLLGGFLILCGCVTLLIPGLVLALSLSAASWLVADRRARALESVLLSQRLTRGRRMTLFGLGLASTLVLLVGALALGIGIVVAYPLVWLAMAHAYLHMIGDSRDDATIAD